MQEFEVVYLKRELDEGTCGPDIYVPQYVHAILVPPELGRENLTYDIAELIIDTNKMIAYQLIR